jgi:cytochrome c oxidase subunit 2
VGAPGFEPTEKRGDNYLMEVDNEVVVPVNKKIRMVTTANDVIHSWSIPAFGVKQDAIPGFVRDTWFKAEHTGTFRGHCSELCGKEHAFMPIVVRVVSDAITSLGRRQEKEMAALADDPNKTWTIDELKTKGEKSMPPTAWPATRPTARACRRLRAAGRLACGQRARKAEQINVLLHGKKSEIWPKCQRGSNCRIRISPL